MSEPAVTPEPGTPAGEPRRDRESVSGTSGAAGPPPEVRLHRRAGDGWVEAPDGSRYWGRLGAAGMLICDPGRGVLLQHRVAWSAHGGTWGIPGGALDVGEDAVTGALRECHEEAGVPRLDGADVRIIGTHVLDKDVWSYTTVLAVARERLDEYVNDPESVELRWVPLGEVTDYPLHPGFAAAWPEHRARLEAELAR
ncbi:NUDIX hydrolase [Sediminivirga luteola]|uniref:Nudix hydrolase domain-containing protein n=1 Tax=Sediminivirga luteola TaxID=1774748 RepID=A0A8J2TWU7_9MICO|nr:NUDIX hydrolase [Sediminivirga luteola]MCI2265513.1 NUDIX hydrolase [Sediminivirga luteola]GGA09944.1 hypothetical protein GCM10011333_10850 [Sediminivirga luteola]